MPVKLIPVDTNTDLGTIFINPDHISSISRDESLIRTANELSRVGMLSGDFFLVGRSPEDVWKMLAAASEDADSNPWALD